MSTLSLIFPNTEKFAWLLSPHIFEINGSCNVTALRSAVEIVKMQCVATSWCFDCRFANDFSSCKELPSGSHVLRIRFGAEHVGNCRSDAKGQGSLEVCSNVPNLSRFVSAFIFMFSRTLTRKRHPKLRGPCGEVLVVERPRYIFIFGVHLLQGQGWTQTPSDFSVFEMYLVWQKLTSHRRLCESHKTWCRYLQIQCRCFFKRCFFFLSVTTSITTCFTWSPKTLMYCHRMSLHVTSKMWNRSGRGWGQ